MPEYATGESPNNVIAREHVVIFVRNGYRDTTIADYADVVFRGTWGNIDARLTRDEVIELYEALTKADEVWPK